MLVLFQTIITLAVVVVSLGLDQSYVREYHECNNKLELAWICFLPSLVLVMFVVLGLLIWPDWLVGYFYEGETTELETYFFVFLLSVSLIVMVAERYFSVFIRMAENGWAFFISRVLPKFFFLLVVFFIGFAKTLNSASLEFNYLILNQVLAWLVGVLVMFYFVRSIFGNTGVLCFSFARLRTLLVFGLPLVLSGLIFWLFSLTDRLMLAKYASLSDLGVYAMAINIAGVGALLQQVFSTLWHPIIYKKISIDADNLDIEVVMRTVSAVCFFVVCLVAIFAPLLVRFLPEQYDDIKYILAACMLPPIFILQSEVTGIGISIKKRTVLLVFITAAALLVNVFLNYGLIPKFGIAGAALASVVSFFLYLVLKTEMAVMCWKKIKRLEFYFFSVTVSMVSGAQVLYGRDYFYLFILLWFVILMVVLGVYKKNIISLLADVKGKLA